MAHDKSFPRRSFRWATLITFILSFGTFGVFFLLLRRYEILLSPLLSGTRELPESAAVLNALHSWGLLFPIYGLMATLLMFLIMTFLLRNAYTLSSPRGVPGKIEKRTDDMTPKEGMLSQKSKDQRLYLHLISQLQREGRLIDFFAEDLSEYTDAQIGAAARKIHGTCRDVVEKSLSLKAVINQVEGETVILEEGFDQNAIQLSGNIPEDAPFSGILKHRGWQAGKMELPRFTGDGDPNVIAPAEVTVL